MCAQSLSERILQKISDRNSHPLRCSLSVFLVENILATCHPNIQKPGGRMQNFQRTGRRTRNSIITESSRASLFPCGEKKGGFTLTTRGGGLSGTAATTWGGDTKTMGGRSGVGKHSAAMLHRSCKIAGKGMHSADVANAKHSSTGRMIHGSCKKFCASLVPWYPYNTIIRSH